MLDERPLDKIIAPRGTVLHMQGIPFVLAEDTPLWGRQTNWELACRFAEEEETARLQQLTRESAASHTTVSGQMVGA